VSFNILSKSEWVRRYAEILMREGGMIRANARFAAEKAVESADEWATPEDAARDEISHWVDQL
jgi:hypothetical protein